MLLKFSARFEYTSAESRFTSPFKSTGEYSSTRPASATLAREAGSEESPVISPPSATMPAAKEGCTEESAKFAEPSTTWTVRMLIGNGFDGPAADAGAGGAGVDSGLAGCASALAMLTPPSGAMITRA